MAPLRPHDVAVVVRVHNEAASLASVLGGLCARGYRVVVVDDGSTDASAEIARRFPVRLLRHPRNRGAGAALATGLAAALALPARAVATFDADLQHRVEDLDLAIERLARGDVDIVLGSRFLRREDRRRVPWLRRCVLAGGVWLHAALTGIRLTDAHHGLRVFRRSAASRLRLSEPGYAYASELLLEVRRLGLRIGEQPAAVHYDPRTLAKGQRNSGAIGIACRLLALRIAAWRAEAGGLRRPALALATPARRRPAL